jgi:hypothetical protein
VVLALAGHPSAADRPSIAVVIYDQAGVDADTLARAKIGIARIVGDAGVDVVWVRPSAVDSVSTFAIRMLIRPRAVGASGSLMGTTPGEVHEIGGSAMVYYDRVLRSAHQSQHDVAGLLAFAMVHEMGHLLLPAPAHSDSGIMRPSWDGDDLRHIAGGSMQFTPAQQIAIRAKAATCCS